MKLLEHFKEDIKIRVKRTEKGNRFKRHFQRKINEYFGWLVCFKGKGEKEV